MRVWTTPVLAGVLLCPLVLRPVSAADAPDWLAATAAVAKGTYTAKVPAEVLLHDALLEVDEKGNVTLRVRHALRVLTRAGRAEAVARVAYATDADKVRDLKAWVIDPGGAIRRLGKDQTLDVALAENDLYNEQRVRLVNASDEVEVGSVFGFESVLERHTYFNQTQWLFQSALPARLSRLELALPPGWTSQAQHFNLPPQTTAPPAESRLWELRDLPFLDDEPGAPDLTSLAPRLALSYAPPPGGLTEARSFVDWPDVARWASTISDPRAEPDATIQARALELTRGRQDARQRLAALAEFVQRVPYISVQVGMGRFQPHAAPDILAKQYGDCKDKVALLRALLKAVGIVSYPLLVFSDDRSFVRSEWPSPVQFDHVIIAVALEGAAGQPAAIAHPKLGTLLLFDPTSENTRLGDLPEGEQGGLGLLAAVDAGQLVRLPVLPSSASRRVRETRAQLHEQGAVTAQIVERTLGQAAARERRLWRSQARPDYVKTIEHWLAEGLPGVRVEGVEAGDEGENGFRCEVRVSAERYAQLMQGQLLIFKPALVARADSLPLTAVTRQHPVRLHARAVDATERIRLPAGFVVDETPSDVRVETPFGRYTMAIQLEADELVLVRQLETQSVTLPVEEYGRVRDFFRRVMDAEQSTVVLVKK